MQKIVFLGGIFALVLVIMQFASPETVVESNNQEASTTSSGQEQKKSSNAKEIVTGDWLQYRGIKSLSGNVNKIIEGKPVPAWTIQAGTAIDSGPVVKDNKVYAVSIKGSVLAIKLNSGKKIWQRCYCERTRATPLIYSNDAETHLFVGTQKGNFYSLDARTGEIGFVFKTRAEINGGATCFFNRENQISQILFGSHDSFLYSLNARTGDLLWKKETDNYVNGTPAWLDNSLFIGGCDGFLRSLNPLTGSETFAIDLGSYIPASPAVFNNNLYVALHEGKVVALNADNKEKLWIFANEDGENFLGAPAVNDEYVVIAGSEGRVYLLNRSNGLLENKITLQGKIKSEPVIDSKSLLIADLDGFIYNFNLRSAKLNWKLMHNTGVTAPVAVINNGFIVCDQNGGITLYRNAVKK